MKKLIYILILSASLPSLAATDYSDSFESQTRTTYEERGNIFDETRFHGGVALIQSFQDLQIAPGQRERGGIRGFEINVGVDLFSQNWIAQGVLTFFPESNINNTTLTSNSFELQVLYEKPVLYGVTLHGGVGLANRFYNLRTKGIADRSFYSGATAFTVGADYWPSGEVSVGVEVSNHLPIANGDDPSSMDFGIKLTGHF
jgi:hypothetical protein